MVVQEKRYQKLSDRMYRKVFNKNDPFDRLIMELGEKGDLNVCVVSIGNESGKTSRIWGFTETISNEK